MCAIFLQVFTPGEKGVGPSPPLFGRSMQSEVSSMHGEVVLWVDIHIVPGTVEDPTLPDLAESRPF